MRREQVPVVLLSFLLATVLSLSIALPVRGQGEIEIGVIGTSGSGPGQFHEPKGIACNGAYLYVVDSGNDRVQMLWWEHPDLNGRLLYFGEWGSPGNGPGQFHQPSDIAAYYEDAGYTVFVTDTGNHRVQKFTADGEFLLEWGGFGASPGRFDTPTFITVTPDPYVVVSDTGNRRVQVFTTDGTFVRVIGGPGTGNGRFLSPSGVDGFEQGTIYVADAELGVVQMFTIEGEFLRKWTGSGSQPRWMGLFDGAMVDAAGGQVCFLYGSGCLDWAEWGGLDSPFDVTGFETFLSVVTDTGHDRLAAWQYPDPVQRVSWGTIKNLYH